MSDENASSGDSLFERAMRKAQTAGAVTPSNSTSIEEAGMAALTGGGVIGVVKDATAPGTFAYNTVRAPAATLQMFIDALQALGDNDTRAEVSRRGADQATVQFKQLLPTGNWVSAQTITLAQAADKVTVSVSAASLAALGGAASQAGGAALNTLGKVMHGDLLGGLSDAAKSVGRLTESAENMAFSSNVRSTVQRIGNALDDEWQTAQRAQAEQAQQAQIASTCQNCGTPYASPDALQCGACGAPRSQKAAA